STVIGAERVLSTASRAHHRRSRSAASVPLFPSLADADRFPSVRLMSAPQLGMHQPQRLHQKQKQQQASQKLWTSEAFAREIWTHKVEPSVLPCRRPFAAKFCN